MKYSHNGANLLCMAIVSLLLLAGCGGGGGDQRIGALNPNQSPYKDLDTSLIPPTAEVYVDLSKPGDSPAQRWVANLYQPLPAINSPNGIYQNASIRNWSDQIFSQVNQQRLNMGLTQLTRLPHLDAVAQAHARDMALRNFFAHVNPDGMNHVNRLVAAGAPHLHTSGETAAMGQERTSEVTQGWWDSLAHRDIIVTAEFNYTGVGVYFDPTNKEMPMHIAQIFVQFTENPTGYDGWVEPGQ